MGQVVVVVDLSRVRVAPRHRFLLQSSILVCPPRRSIFFFDLTILIAAHHASWHGEA